MPTASLPEAPDNRNPKGSGGRRATTSGQKALANARKLTAGVKVGRPRSYTPELCDEAVKLGAKGFSIASIAFTFGVSRKVLSDWQAAFPEFSDALARAHDAAQHFLERHGQKNLKAKHYQSQVWKTRMASQFSEYRDADKGSNSNGLDLGALVGAISQGVAAATLEAGRPKDDAPAAAQDVVPAAVSFDKPRQ